jgi:hypothetical protein
MVNAYFYLILCLLWVRTQSHFVLTFLYRPVLQGLHSSSLDPGEPQTIGHVKFRWDLFFLPSGVKSGVAMGSLGMADQLLISCGAN